MPRLFLRLAVGLLLACLPLRPWAETAPLARHEASRMSMGSVYAVVAYGADAALPAAVEAAFDEVDRIDRLMSHYKPDSPLSQLNREAGQGATVRVDPELFDFLTESLRYSRESDGAFDVTVGPLMKAWGFFRGEGRVPAPGELDEARGRIGWKHVALDAAARTIRFERSRMELDLGGIAKGYAVDRAVAALKARGIAAALVSAGGSTTYGLGAPPGESGWKLSIQDPVHAQKTALHVVLKDRALSVSGSHEKSFEVGGVRYSHIMDPRTARPVQGLLSVAVLTGTGTAGDALDNVLFVQGVEWSRAYLAGRPGTEAYFFLPAGAGTWTRVRVP